MQKFSEEKTLSLLLSGKHPSAKKYAGHHVLVINDKVFPLKEGEAANEDIEKIEKKYGKTPIITFVPRQDISYMLLSRYIQTAEKMAFFGNDHRFRS